MNRPPAFQFYPKDWRDFKVRRMSYEAQGIYIALLCDMWNGSRDWCSIIDDDKAISKALGIPVKRWLSIRKEIQYQNDPLLRQNGRKLISNRLKKEAKKLKEYRRKQSEKGKKSALTRGTTVKPRLNHGATGRQPEGNSSSSSSSLNKKDIYREIRHEVIKHLNEKVGTNYHPDTDNTIKQINGRLSDKKNPATKEDMIRVINIKTGQWLDDPEKNKYLRPETLFNKTKFEGYRNERKPEDELSKHKKSLEERRY